MKKNIIILHTDQQRYDSLGCNGNPHAGTENIDALAADGCRFTRHITANSTCMPSRASLLTGLYVPGHGVSSNGIALWRRDRIGKEKKEEEKNPLLGVYIKDKIPTLADMLKERGYATASLGKLHLEPHLAEAEYGFYECNKGYNNFPPETENLDFYGFQRHKIILGHGEQVCPEGRGAYSRWLQEKHPAIAELALPGEDTNTKKAGERDDIYQSRIPSRYHNSMWLADEACDYLENRKEQDDPFFLFVGFPDPHHPFTPPEDISGPFIDAPLPGFAAMDQIKGAKSSFSNQAMDYLHAVKVDCEQAYRNTLASVYLIDQAVGQIVRQLKESGQYDDTIIIFTSDHGDCLGDFEMLMKANIAFNNLVHVPFIIKGPKGRELPAVMDRPMSNADVVPTVMSMLDLPCDEHVQGVDIFADDSSDNTPMVTCYGASPEGRNISLFDDKYRYTYFIDNGEEELYDHCVDPKELNNLVNDPESDVSELCRSFKNRLFQKHIECDLGIFNHYGLW